MGAFSSFIKYMIFIFIVDETSSLKQYYKIVSTTTTTSHVFHAVMYNMVA